METEFNFRFVTYQDYIIRSNKFIDTLIFYMHRRKLKKSIHWYSKGKATFRINHAYILIIK